MVDLDRYLKIYSLPQKELFWASYFFSSLKLAQLKANPYDYPHEILFCSCLLLLVVTLTHAQVGIGTSNVNSSARLQIDATNKGFLPPRMTSTQRNSLTTPAGLVIYNSTDNRLDVLQDATWRSMATLDGTETLTNKTISGGNNTISNVSLTSGVTGILPIANGGTGTSTSTGSGSVVLSNSPVLNNIK